MTVFDSLSDETLKRDFVDIKFFHFDGEANNIACRTNSSDEYLVKKIFFEEEYFLGTGWQDWSPKLIIDGGANVGYASLYFNHHYPKTKIIAIEPDEQNFRLLEYNTQYYPNIKCLRTGIWRDDSWLKVKDIGLGAWGMVTEQSSESELNALRAMSISSILAYANCDYIDLLKLDVEGAEKEIFSSNYESWLPRVKVLVIELHDRLKTGCSKALFSAVSKFDFSFEIRGENCIFVNNAFDDSYRNSMEARKIKRRKAHVALPVSDWLNQTHIDIARIDIKNQGENNDVKIKVLEGSNCNVDKAGWFSNGGIGYTLVTEDKHLFLELECMGSGTLLLRLQGINKITPGGERLPLWVDYTRLAVNKEVVFWEVKSQWHDKPYVFKKQVSNGEKVQVEISWSEHAYKGEELAKLLYMLK